MQKLNSKFFRKLLINDAVASIKIIDKNGSLIFHNNTCANILKSFSPKEINKLWLTKVHPDDLQNYSTIYKNSISLLKPYSVQYRFLDNNGNYLCLYEKGRPCFKDNKQFMGFIISSFDISAQKENEKKISHLNALYSAMHETDKILIKAKEKKDIFKDICKICVEYGHFQMAWIGTPNLKTKLFDCASYFSRSKKGYKYLKDLVVSIDKNNPEGNGPTGMAYRNNKCYIIRDAYAELPFLPWKEKALGADFHSIGSFPISHNETTYGVLDLYSSQKNYFDEELILLINRLAENTAFVLNNLELEEKQRNYEDYLILTSRVFESSNDIIIITDKDDRIIIANKAFERITGYNQDEVIDNKPTIIMSDQNDTMLYKEIRHFVNKNGGWEGELEGRRKDGAVFPSWLSIHVIKDKKGAIINKLGILSDLSQKKQMEKRADYLAQHDPLTGLPNRDLLLDRLQQSIALAMRLHKKIALLYINVDSLKTINDSLGYTSGDLLLQALAKGMDLIIRESDTVSNIGGDKFIIIINNITHPEDILKIIASIYDKVSTPFKIKEHLINITLSIGVSIYPDDGDSAQLLINNAERAFYSAKDSGGNNYKYYSSDMNKSSQYLFELGNDLKLALSRNEFILYYQPKVSFKSGIIIGAEALIRWNHPKFGIISPVKFIPIAENRGFIKPIGAWVIDEVCRQISIWKKAELPDIPIAINLSAIQLEDDSFKNDIADKLTKAYVDPSIIELEITETTVMKNTQTNFKNLNALKELKLQISMDDFGTGYSSLNHLVEYPIDKLKVDRSFISGITKDSKESIIIKYIIRAGKELGLSIIAEGVETKEQLELLRSWGCDEYQGFYFSKPVPSEIFAELVRKNNKLNP